jgi:hypothetical protein
LGTIILVYYTINYEKGIVVLCLLSNGISSIFAQEERPISPFLFEEYKEAIYNIYMIGKEQKEIKNMKQLLKHYSKHKDLLEKYIDENDIKFDNALQMLQLVKYADSLGE